LTWDVLAHCDLTLTKSGTATLEAMILKKPMVIVYRGSRLMVLEGRLRWRRLNITHIGLPNIIAGERLFAELLQDEATPEAIADLAVELLLQPGRILALKERLHDLVRDNLGEPGGIRRTAALLLDLIAASDKPL
jgi:lipid-A-disaccharide synthase